MTKILLVEDDSLLAEALAEAIADRGYTVDLTYDGQSAWKLIHQSNYNLLVIDVMLPKLDGLSLCRQLRSEGVTTPILTITARNDYEEQSITSEIGANDCIVKPINLKDLLSRIQLLLSIASKS